MYIEKYIINRCDHDIYCSQCNVRIESDDEFMEARELYELTNSDTRG